MKTRLPRISAQLLAALAALTARAALADQPHPWQIGMQVAASPSFQHIQALHNMLLYIIAGIVAFVFALLLIVIVRFNSKVNPVPSEVAHNPVLEVIWTVIPVIILIVVAIPSFKLIFYTDRTPKPGDTSPVYQNMSTFTLGLGIPGELNYQIDYASATTGDFADIVKGDKDWPDPSSSSYHGFADPSNTVTERIDDLWHAAVNGRGYYYSAGDPASLISGLTDALQRIDAQAGASASAATRSRARR